MGTRRTHKPQDINAQMAYLRKKQRFKMRNRHKNDETFQCQLWECDAGCIPCIIHICSALSEIQGKCGTCKQKSWAVCLYDLHKIPSKLLV